MLLQGESLSLCLMRTRAAVGSSATAFLASHSTPWSSSLIKRSGITCGIKVADGHSGSDGQDLHLEASNRTASLLWFQRPRERSALAEPKCCWKSDTPRTGWPCFLICLTPPILLANMAAICQQLQNLMEWHLSLSIPKGRGRRAEGFPCAGSAARRAAAPGAARNHPSQLMWQEHRRQRGLKLPDRNESSRDGKGPEETLNP